MGELVAVEFKTAAAAVVWLPGCVAALAARVRDRCRTSPHQSALGPVCFGAFLQRFLLAGWFLRDFSAVAAEHFVCYEEMQATRPTKLDCLCSSCDELVRLGRFQKGPTGVKSTNH